MKWYVPVPTAVALILLLLTGCGGGGGGSSATSTVPSKSSSSPAPAAGLVARGKELYTAKGCNACHSLNGQRLVGPSWKGLAGSTVTLADGKTVTADPSYLVTSIEDPDKQIVAGYKPGVMSGTIPPGSVSAADARALAAFIASLR